MSLLFGPLMVGQGALTVPLKTPQSFAELKPADPQQRTDYDTNPAPTVDGAYTLVCDAGEYTYTGSDATLTYEAGASGVAYSLVCDAGAYTYTGVAATLTLARNLSLSTGEYTYAGNDATLTYVHGAVNYMLDLATGAYVYTGVAATLGYVPGASPQPEQASNWQANYWKKRSKADEDRLTKEERMRLGILPRELEAVAKSAVDDAINASIALNAGEASEENALACAMQARLEYEDAFVSAYKEAYIAEVVSENWNRAMKINTNRRAAVLLLLH